MRCFTPLTTRSIAVRCFTPAAYIMRGKRCPPDVSDDGETPCLPSSSKTQKLPVNAPLTSRADKAARATRHNLTKQLEAIASCQETEWHEELTEENSYWYGLGYYRSTRRMYEVLYFLLLTLQLQIVEFWKWLDSAEAS